MTITEIKKQALKALKGQWGVAAALTLIIFIINSVLPTIFEVMLSGGWENWFLADQLPIQAEIVSMIITLLIMPLAVTTLWFFLSLVRYEGPQLFDVFAIFTDGKRFFKLIGTSIVMGIFIALWTLLLLIPGIIKSISYSQTYFLMKDHPEYTVLEAITESKKRMKGYKWKYFLLNLSFIGWGILCLLTLGIGFLWLSPYIQASTATFYNELILSQEHNQEPVQVLEDQNWEE
ncbi:DUF975 family protein [Bacillus marasmi]|uniref:DUF975 family protein n=1 Tax=Bacillus marasmi TaxID=1926279 RepID=UPI0011C89060|nr:DUF975 family protein [Bacillus marasmi]